MNQQQNQTGSQAQTSTQTQQTSKFDIPPIAQQKYPELIALIMETESMNDDERQYWFQILPIMTDDQIEKLKNILVNEKEQLAAIDKKYQEEIISTNSKQESEWDAFKAKEIRENIKKQENAEKHNEKNLEEDLLNRLNQQS